MEAMKTIEETRRDRLAMLEQEFGSQVHLAELIGKSPVQISQWKNASKYSGSEKRRSMDSGTARLIEDKTGKPRGWMDQPLQRYQPQSGDVALRAQETADPYGYVRFELLSVSAAAGRGLTAQMPEVLSHLLVDESWARRTFGERISRVHLITARGTSMQGTIENGDVIFVDAGIRHFDGDGIYVIARENEVQVKRLQRLQGGVLAIISDNRAYEAERLSGEEANHLVICGRVLAAWTLNKFW